MVARFQIAVIDDLRLHCPFNERRLRAASKPRVVGIERDIKLVRRPDRAQLDGRARIGIGERSRIADGGKYTVRTSSVPCGKRPARFLRKSFQITEREGFAAREHIDDKRPPARHNASFVCENRVILAQRLNQAFDCIFHASA